MAEEVTLERPPPYAQFEGHALPPEGEFSRLIEPRLQAMHLSQLRNRDEMRERRRRLNGNEVAPKKEAGKFWKRKEKKEKEAA